MKTPLLICAVLLVTAEPLHGQQADTWIGRRVLTQYGTVLKVGNNVVDDEGRTTSLTTSGRDRRSIRVYRVEHVNGEWLWLKDENGGVAGWVQAAYVVPFEQAISYYSGLIRSNPTANLYISRGIAWEKNGEYDLAIADFNEAIRLDPRIPSAYNNRGLAWSGKKDFDRAITDFDEAIRLDPRYSLAYINRGNAWSSRKEYDKAIADYVQAIRFDRKDAWPYNNRGNAWKHKREFEKAIADYDEAIRLDPKFALAYRNRAWCWATCPDEKYRDGKQAVESALRACELSEWKDANSIVTLAAACAEAGDFAKAVQYQEQANKLYTGVHDRKEGEKRLDLYKDKQPYRDTNSQ